MTKLGIMASQISGHLIDPNAYIAFSMLSTNSVQVYIWNNGTGFGSKFADPSGTQSRTSVGIRPDKKVIAVGGATPSIQAYPWSQSGFGTIYSAPATAYTTQAYGLNWTSTGNDIGMAIDGSPYGVIYAWSSGFGSKYANPATLPAENGISVAWNNLGTDVFSANYNVSPYVAAYAWSSGFGSKYSNPATAVSNTTYDVSFAA